MTRGKGTANLAASLEVLAGAPLDARLVCPTVADLYIASNWPYKYIGMKTTVQATGDTYRLVNLDVTQESSWVKEGATEYDDFTGATSQDAGVHGLVPAPAISDMEKFLKGDGTWAVVPIPSFDYSNTSPDAMNFSTDEKVIGTWIDGKPLYQKSFITTLSNDLQTSIPMNVSIDKYIDITAMQYSDGYFRPLTVISNDFAKYTKISAVDNTMASGANTLYIRTLETNYQGTDVIVIVRYTKTTDSPVASGEKIIGQWIDGKPLYEKIISTTLPEITIDGENNSKLVSIGASIDIGFIAGAFFKSINNNYNSIVFISSAMNRMVNAVVYPNNGIAYQNALNMNCNSISYSEAPVYFIVHYTKAS